MDALSTRLTKKTNYHIHEDVQKTAEVPNTRQVLTTSIVEIVILKIRVWQRLRQECTKRSPEKTTERPKKIIFHTDI